MTPSNLSRLRNDQRGVAAVEFALVAPILLMMLLGSFEVARALQARNALREAVGSVGRDVVVAYQDGTGDTSAAIRNKVIASASDRAHLLDPADLAVVVGITDNATYGIRQITINATYEFGMEVPFLPARVLRFQQNRVMFIPNA